MKKQELIHLHGLLAEVSDHFEACGEELDLSEYEDRGVRPSSIHKSKTAHKDAVFDLVCDITGSLGTESNLEQEVTLADRYLELKKYARGRKTSSLQTLPAISHEEVVDVVGEEYVDRLLEEDYLEEIDGFSAVKYRLKES